LKLPPLATNLIGSFPLANNRANFARAIDDQVKAGLDFVSYPQLADMNSMFLDPLVDGATIRREGNGFEITQDFQPVVTKEVRRWVEDAHEILRGKKGTIPLKACVTGPFTLSSVLKVEGAKKKPFPSGYLDLVVEHPWVIEKLAGYVHKVCARYSTLSSIVSVDEPFLSVLIGKRTNLLELSMSRAQATDLVAETLDETLHGVRTIPCIHVCGGIGRQLSEILLGTSAKIISHEFSRMDHNFESYEPDEPESYSKVLSVGVVSTSPTNDQDGVEPTAVVERKMEGAISRYGVENVVFSPDCGFRPLADLLGQEEGYSLAMRKIAVLVSARQKLAAKLGLIGVGKR